MIKSTEGRTVGHNTTKDAPPRMSEPTMHLSIDQVQQLIALMGTTDLSEIAIDRPEAGLRLVLRCNAPTVEAPALVADTPSAEAEPQPTVMVKAQLVGTFNPAVKPGQAPIVAVGDSVRAGQTIAGVESLNVMNEVEAPVAGRITQILVGTGQRVEYGQPLIEITPDNR